MTTSDDDAITLEVKVVLKADRGLYVVRVSIPSVHISVERRNIDLRRALEDVCIECSAKLRAQDWDTTPEQVMEAVECALENADLHQVN